MFPSGVTEDTLSAMLRERIQSSLQIPAVPSPFLRDLAKSGVGTERRLSDALSMARAAVEAERR